MEKNICQKAFLISYFVWVWVLRSVLYLDLMRPNSFASSSVMSPYRHRLYRDCFAVSCTFMYSVSRFCKRRSRFFSHKAYPSAISDLPMSSWSSVYNVTQSTPPALYSRLRRNSESFKASDLNCSIVDSAQSSCLCQIKTFVKRTDHCLQP